MFDQNYPQNRFHRLKSNFVSFFYKKQDSTLSLLIKILIKIKGLWILMKSWEKKTKGTTLFFDFFLTQNGISSGKIDFLNNSDKTWYSMVNSKMLRFFEKNTKMLISKTVL